jgi:hypothetical protein
LAAHRVHEADLERIAERHRRQLLLQTRVRSIANSA